MVHAPRLFKKSAALHALRYHRYARRRARPHLPPERLLHARHDAVWPTALVGGLVRPSRALATLRELRDDLNRFLYLLFARRPYRLKHRLNLLSRVNVLHGL